MGLGFGLGMDERLAYQRRRQIFEALSVEQWISVSCFWISTSLDNIQSLIWTPQ